MPTQAPGRLEDQHMGQLDDIRAAVAASGRRAVEARFYLTTAKTSLSWDQAADPPVLAGFDFSAAKHGTFGSATPSGMMQMQVANPHAAQLLLDTQHDAIHDRRKNPSFRIWLVEELPDEAE